ncbi:MAG: tRNA uridine-5-carboxymethylaminomethyl(34) synthesis GTPase MnmE [Anaerorhabdus sp.]
MNDTIVAISTSLQEGAVAIIRLSGDDAIDIVNKIFTKDLSKIKSHTINYGFIKDDAEIVDEVLVSVFKSPKSYTTEDIVEINSHGGIIVTKRILQLCLAFGARLANKGEFTKRAFINGRIDLIQAESVMDLLSAKNITASKAAISGIQGAVSDLINPLCNDLIEMIATIEVNIDYPEYEDIQKISEDIIYPKAKEWLLKIEKIIEMSQSACMIRKGIKTAIIGKPNVGKSSLLNALLKEDKAIVTEHAGTTRDIVEGEIMFGNILLKLLDTAGIRETNDEIEKIGIEKSRKIIDEADLCLVVLDGSKAIDQEDEILIKATDHKNRIIVYNKKDLAIKEGICISSKNQDLKALEDEIIKRFEKEVHVSSEVTLINERQIALALAAKMAMKDAILAIENGLELDLVTIDLQKGYRSMKEILGEVSKDDLLDTLFSRFCLGK